MENKLALQEYKYEINGKTFFLKSDFTFKELDGLEPVLAKVQVQQQHQIGGSFTKKEIKNTLKILLTDENGKKLTDHDFASCRQSMSAEIIANFFLTRAVLGIITANFSNN